MFLILKFHDRLYLLEEEFVYLNQFDLISWKQNVGFVDKLLEKAGFIEIFLLQEWKFVLRLATILLMFSKVYHLFPCAFNNSSAKLPYSYSWSLFFFFFQLYNGKFIPMKIVILSFLDFWIKRSSKIKHTSWPFCRNLNQLKNGKKNRTG